MVRPFQASFQGVTARQGAVVPDRVKRILVIGVGHPLCGDGSVGLRVAQAVRARWPEAVRVFEHGGEGATLLHMWAPEDGVFLFSASESGAAPGTLSRFEAAVEDVPRHFLHSFGHPFGIAEAIEAARRTGRLPARLIVYGLEGASFGEGEQLSEPARRGLQELTSRALAEVRSLAERALAERLSVRIQNGTFAK